MQVILASEEMKETAEKGRRKLCGLFTWFGTEAIGWSLGFGAFIVVWWFAILFNEVWHRRKMQHRVKKRLKIDAEGT